MLYYVILCYIILYYIILYYIILYYIILYYIILYCIVLYYSIVYYVMLCYVILNDIYAGPLLFYVFLHVFHENVGPHKDALRGTWSRSRTDGSCRWAQ